MCQAKGLFALLALILLGAHSTAAQSVRVEGAAPSSQPMLIEVRIEGNKGVPTDNILAAITARASDITPLDRYTILLSDVQRFIAPDSAIGAELDAVVDEAVSGIRLLNTGAAVEDVSRIKRLYNGYGFHDVVVSTRYLVDTTNNVAIIRYIINEAERYRLRGVRWVYSGTAQLPEQIRAELEQPESMAPGDYFSQERLYADITRAITILKNNGYPSASLAYPPRLFTIRRNEAAQFGSDVGFDSAEVEIAPGKRFRFGRTDVRPDTSTVGRPIEPEYVLDQMEYEYGEWYSREKLDASQANLYGLGLFDLVSFVDSVSPSEPGVVNYRIFTRRRPQNDLRFVPDISFERRSRDYIWTLGFSSLYSRINLFGRGEIGGASARLLLPLPIGSEELQGGGLVTFTLPGFPSKSRRTQISTSYDRQIAAVINDFDDASQGTLLRNNRFATAGELALTFFPHNFFNRLVGALKVQWNKYTNVRAYVDQYERNLRRAAEIGGFDFAAVRDYARQTALRTYILQGDDPSLLAPDDDQAYRAFDNIKQTWILAGSAVGDKRNDFFSPSRGYLIDLGSELGFSGLFGFSGIPSGSFNGMFVKLEGSWRQFLELGSRTILAYRAHFGNVWEFGSLPLTPQSNRFRAGGANSIRGWGVREMLATRDDLGIAANVSDSTRRAFEEIFRDGGGLGILELNVELRYRFFSFPSGSSLSILNDLLFIPFIDAGNAFFRDSDDPERISYIPNIALAAGVSLGYNTPVGPIRGGVGVPVYDPVDLALKTTRERLIFNRKPFDLLVFHVGIGHAF